MGEEGFLELVGLYGLDIEVLVVRVKFLLSENYTLNSLLVTSGGGF